MQILRSACDRWLTAATPPLLVPTYGLWSVRNRRDISLRRSSGGRWARAFPDDDDDSVSLRGSHLSSCCIIIIDNIIISIIIVYVEKRLLRHVGTWNRYTTFKKTQTPVSSSRCNIVGAHRWPNYVLGAIISIMNYKTWNHLRINHGEIWGKLPTTRS